MLRAGFIGLGNQGKPIALNLVAAGFATGVIYKILRQWDVPEESLSALENLDETGTEE